MPNLDFLRTPDNSSNTGWMDTDGFDLQRRHFTLMLLVSLETNCVLVSSLALLTFVAYLAVGTYRSLFSAEI